MTSMKSEPLHELLNSSNDSSLFRPRFSSEQSKEFSCLESEEGLVGFAPPLYGTSRALPHSQQKEPGWYHLLRQREEMELGGVKK